MPGGEQGHRAADTTSREGYFNTANTLQVSHAHLIRDESLPALSQGHPTLALEGLSCSSAKMY